MPKYINADEMMEDESEAYLNVMGQPLDYATRIVNQAVHIKLQRLLSDAPTADVQEVRHGHWIEDKETGCLICSECGRFTDEIIGDMIEQDGKIIHRSMNPFYCSKCGAKMDVEE